MTQQDKKSPFCASLSSRVMLLSGLTGPTFDKNLKHGIRAKEDTRLENEYHCYVEQVMLKAPEKLASSDSASNIA